MTDSEKLEKLISEIQYMGGLESRLAEHLLANGVTFSVAVPGHENNYDIAEMAYNNGYAKGCDDSKPTWIPVSERLPDKDGRFLCLWKFSGYHHTVLSFAKDGKKVDYHDLTGKKDVWYEYDREWGFVAINSVTHWMPLPEPPKEE